MNQFSAKSQLISAQIIHLSMMIFPLFAALAIIFSNDYSLNQEQSMEFMDFAPAIALLIVIVISNSLFKKILASKLKNDKTLKSKMAAFINAHIVQMALFEGVSFFAIVISFLTESPFNLGIVAVIFIISISKMPTVFKLETILELSREEKEQFY